MPAQSSRGGKEIGRDTPSQDDTGTGESSRGNEPQWFLVRSSHKSDNRRILFRSVSESRARGFLRTRYPRGSEAYLEKPDGSFEHYEAERAGEHGEDVDLWQPFDPESYRPPAEITAPGESAWADMEG